MMAATERLCEGMTSKGRLCNQPAAIGSRFCPYHDPNLTISTRWNKATAQMTRDERESLRRTSAELADAARRVFDDGGDS
jgi:hypothetical protein